MDLRTDSVSDILAHYGIKRRSGRYPFGSGDRPYQRYKPTGSLEFNKAEVNVRKSLSNHYTTFVKQDIDMSAIKSRSRVTDSEAAICIINAKKKFKEAARQEPNITDDVVTACSESGCKMYGLEHRLKQPTSLAGKIGIDAKEKGLSFNEASRGIKDAIRYTVVSEPDNFVENYNKIKNNLEDKGYSENRCKNFFERYKHGESMHKAVQCTYKSPGGYEFELQFQTPASQAAKELKIPIYEERRKIGISQERALELESEMRELAEQVQDPPNISKIREPR